MQNPISSLLTELGLSDLECDIYQRALGLGTFPATAIAQRIKAPRSTVRYNCDMLVERGLLMMTRKGNTKLYTAENPTKLYALLYEEESALKRKKEQLALTIKELQNQYNPNAKLPKVTFYEGIDGIERMFEDLLFRPSEVYSFGAGDYFMQRKPEFIKKFREKVLKFGKNAYVMRVKKYKESHKNDPKNIQSRYFTLIQELEADFQVVDDTLLITTIDPTEICIAIKNEKIASTFRIIFQELWDTYEAKD